MIFSELIPKKSIFLWNIPNYKKIKSLQPKLDFPIAAKLMHLVSDVVFEGLAIAPLPMRHGIWNIVKGTKGIRLRGFCWKFFLQQLIDIRRALRKQIPFLDLKQVIDM